MRHAQQPRRDDSASAAAAVAAALQPLVRSPQPILEQILGGVCIKLEPPQSKALAPVRACQQPIAQLQRPQLDWGMPRSLPARLLLLHVTALSCGDTLLMHCVRTQALQNGIPAQGSQNAGQPGESRSQRAAKRRDDVQSRDQPGSGPSQPSDEPRQQPPTAGSGPAPVQVPGARGDRRPSRAERPSRQQQQQQQGRQQTGSSRSARPPADSEALSGPVPQAAAGPEPPAAVLHPPRGDPMAVGDASQDSDPPSPGPLSTPSTPSSPVEQAPQTLPAASDLPAQAADSAPGEPSRQGLGAADLPPGLSSSQQPDTAADHPPGLGQPGGRTSSSRGRQKRGGSKRKAPARAPLSNPSSAADLPSGFEGADPGPSQPNIRASSGRSAEATAEGPAAAARLILVGRQRKPRKPCKPQERSGVSEQGASGQQVQQPLGGGPAGLGPESASDPAAGAEQATSVKQAATEDRYRPDIESWSVTRLKAVLVWVPVSQAWRRPPGPVMRCCILRIAAGRRAG